MKKDELLMHGHYLKKENCVCYRYIHTDYKNYNKPVKDVVTICVLL